MRWGQVSCCFNNCNHRQARGCLSRRIQKGLSEAVGMYSVNKVIAFQNWSCFHHLKEISVIETFMWSLHKIIMTEISTQQMLSHGAFHTNLPWKWRCLGCKTIQVFLDNCFCIFLQFYEYFNRRIRWLASACENLHQSQWVPCCMTSHLHRGKGATPFPHYPAKFMVFTLTWPWLTSCIFRLERRSQSYSDMSIQLHKNTAQKALSNLCTCSLEKHTCKDTL